ncbi:TetR family transcriptional regulator [Novosphingobium sp. PhB165]|uniref:TetR/AcrR family transcriptional regulator n=1 Tax=Novosphingobium sp. PhB165 TaxID=2485105 RepID=UPI001043785B|nr:TetR/AcrR family transcriptional regulator [Novosphingobium sp. PhB165]TCM17890.1 TetR family transcriptional regulator [Novosphingobium sp. PhB165]
MRADARKHRQDLIEAAALVFAAKGPTAPLQDVLAVAGLGRGTLYRHFADREALIMAVIEFEVFRTLAEVETRKGDPALFEDFLESQSRAFAVHMPVFMNFDEGRLAAFVESVGPTFDRIIAMVLETAKALDQVHSDLGVEDLKLAIEMLSMARGSKSVVPEDVSYARGAALLFGGIRPRPTGEAAKTTPSIQ